MDCKQFFCEEDNKSWHSATSKQSAHYRVNISASVGAGLLLLFSLCCRFVVCCSMLPLCVVFLTDDKDKKKDEKPTTEAKKPADTASASPSSSSSSSSSSSASTSVTSSSSSPLPLTPELQAILSSHPRPSSSLCENCDEHPAKKFCPTCKMWLCEADIQELHKMKQQHKIVDFGS
jgi:hypothetical protein